jgi:hypothetical protein
MSDGCIQSSCSGASSRPKWSARAVSATSMVPRPRSGSPHGPSSSLMRPSRSRAAVSRPSLHFGSLPRLAGPRVEPPSSRRAVVRRPPTCGAKPTSGQNWSFRQRRTRVPFAAANRPPAPCPQQRPRPCRSEVYEPEPGPPDLALRRRFRPLWTAYGTEGQRFESSRARFVSREKLPANRHFLGGADVLGGWQHRGQQGNSAGRW